VKRGLYIKRERERLKERDKVLFGDSQEDGRHRSKKMDDTDQF
jgi:hypothetical protein